MSKSYHDLHIQTADIPRTSIFNLPFGYMVTCTRTAGWELWQDPFGEGSRLIAGEYDPKGLRLDVDAAVIVDSLTGTKAESENQVKTSAENG